ITRPKTALRIATAVVDATGDAEIELVLRMDVVGKAHAPREHPIDQRHVLRRDDAPADAGHDVLGLDRLPINGWHPLLALRTSNPKLRERSSRHGSRRSIA